jgi:ATP-dependent Zn protease
VNARRGRTHYSVLGSGAQSLLRGNAYAASQHDWSRRVTSRAPEEHPPHDDARRAAHEAGHVLVALTVGWDFEYVTIDADPRFPDFIGHVQYARPVRTYTDLPAWAATFLGGRVAELTLTGSRGIGSQADERLVADILAGSYANEAQRRAAGRAALERAQQIVETNLPALRAVRDALLDRRRLEADEVAALVRSATGHGRREPS